MTNIEIPNATIKVTQDVTCDCAHCGLPVPMGLIEKEATDQFCCKGCRAVFEVIHGCGLDQFYTLRDSSDATPVRAGTTGKAYEEFDDETFRSVYAQELNSGRFSIELYAEGVHCVACVWLIEKLPYLLEGVTEAKLDFGQSLVRIVWDPGKLKLSAIAKQLDALGYPVHPMHGGAARDVRKRDDRRQMIRIAAAGAIAGNVMIIAFALYGGMFHGMDPATHALFRWTSLGLTLVSLLWPGRTFLQGAFNALRLRTVHMDLPIALGLIAGTLCGALNTVRGVGEVYFESITVLIFLLLIGRWIQTRQQRKSYDAVEMLFAMTSTTAHVRRGETIVDVPIEAILEGDIVVVRVGESIPADGIVCQGDSDLNRSFLTGESKPIGVTRGDSVDAGTTNLTSPLEIKVEATGQQTRLGKLIRLVEESARNRAPVVKLADRVAGVFVVVVIVLAGATVLGWWGRDPDFAIQNAIALLIVTCPCALGLATPLAIISAIGKAAKQGVLIKGGEVIEQLNRPGLLLLDKTGTLTTSTMALQDWKGEESIKTLVAALESHSSHPIAKAFVEQIEMPVGNVEVVDVCETMGQGISGRIGDRNLVIGSESYLQSLGVDLPDAFASDVQEFADRALTPILIAIDGQVTALAGLGDPLRAGVVESIQIMRREGWRVGVLSGDHPKVVEAIALQAGIDLQECRGGVSPEAKLAFVEERAACETVIMVGDGVNDAAALAAASVGVSVKGGAEASLAAADVYLGRTGLAQIDELVRGAGLAMGVIRLNIIVSLLYNVVGASLAIFGVINPLIAAVLMPLSSLSVITLSVKAKTYGDESCR